MRRPPPPDGIAVVDKAAGWTSHDVVAKSRGILGTRKIGHAGTLDPSATGVLVLGIGRATRLLRYLGDVRKSYLGEMVLGSETTTLDADGEDHHSPRHVGRHAGRRAAAQAQAFVGPIMQIPPMVSAVQIGGRRLHELARQGIEVEREPRAVTVYELEVGPTADAGVFRLEVEVFVGNLRAFAGRRHRRRAWAGAAHLRNLRRAAPSGPSRSMAPVALDALDQSAIRPPVAAVGHLDRVTVDDEVAVAVGHGKVLPAELLAVAGSGPWAVLDDSGSLLAVYIHHRDGTVKPDLVMPPA